MPQPISVRPHQHSREAPVDESSAGIGVSNALQGDSSSISFQIGSKVFTNAKGFPLGQLPFELRELIVLMALEESRRCVSTLGSLPPLLPFSSRVLFPSHQAPRAHL